MNKNNRKQLAQAIQFIEDAKGIIENIKDDEQGKFDNLNEGLQASQRGQDFEQNATDLEEVVGSLDEAIEKINEVDGR
jgi:hypothetical protein